MSVYQPWDPLRVCVVGRSYPPEFYSWIKNPRLRSLFERIAIETEEDYQGIIATLEKFNIQVIRPNCPNSLDSNVLTSNNRIPGPISMNPRDQMIMIGDKFFVYTVDSISNKVSGRNISFSNWDADLYNHLKGPDWPKEHVPYETLPEWIKQEIFSLHGVIYKPGEKREEFVEKSGKFPWWDPVLDFVKHNKNKIIDNLGHPDLNHLSANGITRCGKDLYFGTGGESVDAVLLKNFTDQYFPDYRCHFVMTGGHIDGCFCPVKPGLIVSVNDIQTYAHTFPGWEVIYLQNESWTKVKDFLNLKAKNQGRWWIKDYENDHELIDFVETWLRDWTGCAEESVFDVNILVIDQSNVVVNSYNKKAFDAFTRHGITPHICRVRHRYFWDGGIHCITLDLDRDGQIRDFFPDRS